MNGESKRPQSSDPQPTLSVLVPVPVVSSCLSTSAAGSNATMSKEETMEAMFTANYWSVRLQGGHAAPSLTAFFDDAARRSTCRHSLEL